jgi:hypothetical protein
MYFFMRVDLPTSKNGGQCIFHSLLGWVVTPRVRLSLPQSSLICRINASYKGGLEVARSAQEESPEKKLVECFRHEGEECPRCDGSGFRPRKHCEKDAVSLPGVPPKAAGHS